MKTKNILRRLVALAATTICLAAAGTAQAGSIYLTGHDVLLHQGQNAYDTAIIDWLRNGAAIGGYDIAVVGSGIGSARFTGGGEFTTTGVAAGGNAIPLVGALTGYGSARYYNADSADWSMVLSADLLIYLSHTSCGGCDTTNAGVVAVNAQATAIATAFNAGMDIWANAGANNADFYDFLPPGAATSGPPISGSSGFDATNAGDAIGILPGMINGFQTHNRFAGFDSDFTVFETRPATGAVCDTPPFATGCEIISIGIRDATIGDGGIGTDAGTVPEPGVLALLSLGALGMALTRRRKRQ